MSRSSGPWCQLSRNHAVRPALSPPIPQLPSPAIAATMASPCPCSSSRSFAVHDQSDVRGQRDTGQLPAQLAGVQAIGKIARHASNLLPTGPAPGRSR